MNNKANLSIVEYFGSDKGHKCGYCKGSKSNLCHGMWAHTMNVEDYESLINRGWRRSGHYCYKPIMKLTCCPQYTIRCSTNNFRMSHSHKKILKKMRNFLSKDADSAFATNCSSKAPIGKPSSVGSQTLPKTLEDYLEEEYHNPFNKLEIKLVDPTSSEFKKTMSSAYKLYVKYQIHVHHDKEEDLSTEQFERFLVKSPLQKSSKKNGPYTGYGTFHQQYWIDGKLVAVGVIDILPTCLSSVYFFYDPDYSHLSLGTYGSLREIAFSRQLGLSDPNFCWYYLGFYIHSCPKMLYKGQYKPSFLLCPETYTFQPFEECVIKLNRNKYSVLLEKTGDVYEDESISKVGILYRRQAATFDVYSLRQKVEEEEVKEVEEYAMLVGRSSSNRMLLYRS